MPMARNRIDQLVLVLEQIAEVAESLASFVVPVIRFIRICIRIWTIWTAKSNIKLDTTAVPMARNRIEKFVLILEQIAEVSESLASFVVQVIPFIRTCIRIWTIWTARQPASVGNGDQDDDEAEPDADCEL